MPDVVTDAINAIRFLSADAVQRANSGHPGTPMALAPLAYALYTRHVRHDPADPAWADRDRVVLSAGHASMLLYSTLHLCGYGVSLDDLRSFRQWGSSTPGHPERHDTPGIEVTTGPLGQGFGNAVGMAIAEQMLAARFGDTVVDHRTWVIAGDGDLMEGVTSEAASLAGHLGLGKLTVFYDDNDVTLSGPAAMSFHEQVRLRFEAYGWHVTDVADVNDLAAIDAAVAEATAAEGQPSLVIVKSHIGYGSPLQDSYKAHGSPLGEENLAAARARLGWEYAPFEVPEAVYDHVRGLVAERAEARRAWSVAWQAKSDSEPELAEEYERRLAGKLPAGWDDSLPTWPLGTPAMPTRKAGHVAENTLAARVPELVGGSADLDPSTLTVIDEGGTFGRADASLFPADAAMQPPLGWAGRNIEFGVREHAMGSIANGIAAHGALRPFTATFFVFSDYMRPAIRLAALMRLPVVFVFTHDSIGVGEDGPTHQPIEQLAGLRSIPGLHVVRPADVNETMQAWAAALRRTDGPTVLVLSRQNVPTLDPAVVDVSVGASVVAPGDSAAIVATGSEVQVALAARTLLAEDGIDTRVVSMPCWESFRERGAAERAQVLPPGVPTVSVEAAATFGWSEWADASVGIDRFGASAPGPIVMRELGITADAVATRVKELLQR